MAALESSKTNLHLCYRIDSVYKAACLDFHCCLCLLLDKQQLVQRPVLLTHLLKNHKASQGSESPHQRKVERKRKATEFSDIVYGSTRPADSFHITFFLCVNTFLTTISTTLYFSWSVTSIPTFPTLIQSVLPKQTNSPRGRLLKPSSSKSSFTEPLNLG